MKVKFKPEDFYVEEILKEGIIQDNGSYSVYKVTKKEKDTLFVMYDMARQLKVDRDMFSSCGLKDKYSVSVQYIAIKGRNFKRFIDGDGWKAEFIGFTSEPLRPKFIYRNFFKIVLRDIHPDELKDYEENILRISTLGFPNYFDEQRFGSARHFADDDENPENLIDFIGKRILKGDFEGALKIHFQAVSDHTRSRVKKFKKVMRENWGNWAECLVHAQDRNDFKVLRYLIRRPNDFKGAFTQIDVRLARLYLEVYQNFIFNKILATYIKERFEKFYLFPYVVDKFVFPIVKSQDEIILMKNLKIPLPCKEAQIPPELKDVYLRILKEEGVRLEDFDTGMNYVNFVKAERNAWEKPEDIRWKAEDDEFHNNMKKLELSFFLKPGVFATIFIKNITPLLPISYTEKKPIPIIYTKDGKEISIQRKSEDSQQERKKVIILSRSTS